MASADAVEYSESLYKEKLLKTMKAFTDVCRRNDIEYIAAYGTVLGAIRHKGLIPWDDDIDVFMTRENYEKFLRLKKTLAGSDYEIVDLDDKGYYLPFAKFCDANTTIWEVENLPFIFGVFIDVFPLDFVEEQDEACAKLHYDYKALFDKYTHSLKTFHAKDLLSLRGLKSFLKRQTTISHVMQISVCLSTQLTGKRCSEACTKQAGRSILQSRSPMTCLQRVIPSTCSVCTTEP